ncbi:MAG: DNA mismatch repair protein MutS [Pseudomonadota bacterium]
MSQSIETPMFRQYLALKGEHPDAFLFFRMGDFYEMFFDDAERAAPLLEVALTSRNRNDPDPVPMCGVPVRAVDGYIRRLVDAGHKVAIAEQVEDPRLAKGLVERQVVRVVSPGVVLDPEGLEAREPNYLLGVAAGGHDRYGLAFLDVSTGDLRVTETTGIEATAAELGRIPVREAVLPQEIPGLSLLLDALTGALINQQERACFSPAAALHTLRSVLGVNSLEGFGAEGLEPALTAAGVVLQYARDNSRSDLKHIHRLRVVPQGGFMVLDETTRRNLEIFRPLRGTGRVGTLVHLLDQSATPMGGRLIREWLAFPLLDPGAIRERQDLVAALAGDGALRDHVRRGLRAVSDLERIASKIAQGTAHGRDLGALRRSLEALPEVIGPLYAQPVLGPILPQDLCTDVQEGLSACLAEEPSLTLGDGGLIRPGYSAELDELLHLAHEGKGAIDEMEAREREATGISSLKIKHHRGQGYHIEITKAKLHMVPERYLRSQTLTTCERYVTPELKDFEERVLSADARSKALEQELFLALRDRVARELPRLQALAADIARLDVLAALAEVAVKYRYRRPEVHTGRSLELVEARHPVVEALLSEERFVPNSLALEPEQRRLVILTGPNMSGKSTIMRQVALCVLMAQVGSLVPVKSASIGICDRIFVRVGASDDLARGRSTFMVEMAETANILHNATPRSLVLLDEIGRGTSTYDGLSIAWAVAEELHDRIRCLALFATHYHELVGFARQHPRAVNMRVAVSEMGERIIFLRRLQDGSTSRSYGIQCARLAGIPDPVVQRARAVLKELERQRPRDERQLSLFDLEAGAPLEDAPAEPATPAEPAVPDLLRESLSALDPDRLTPREALDALYRLRALL